jgi:hypothetical protein
MADPSDSLVISIATNFDMLVRTHIRNHALRLDGADSIVGAVGRSYGGGDLEQHAPMFGGSSQIPPRNGSPDAALIGSGTNSHAASVLLHNLPFTIDYTLDERFGVLDQRKPTGQNALFVSQPSGNPVSSGVLWIVERNYRSRRPRQQPSHGRPLGLESCGCARRGGVLLLRCAYAGDERPFHRWGGWTVFHPAITLS